MTVRSFFSLAYTTLLTVISLAGQGAIDSLPITFTYNDGLNSVIIEVEDKPSLIISHQMQLDNIHDFYLDEKYCIIVHDINNGYSVTAAYFDVLNQEWIIDYLFKTFAKVKDTGIIGSELHSFKIIDGNHIEIVASKKGPKSILQRLYGTTEFPITYTLQLTISKIAYLEFPGTAGYCSDIRSTSPRPKADN
jgi:hypothetical protein